MIDAPYNRAEQGFTAMKSTMKVAAVLSLLAGAALLASQDQQSAAVQAPTPTFKSQVEYVEVDALVMDQQGNFVRNLTKDDFQILEDGKPQTITTFALVDIPIEQAQRPLFASRPIEPDVQSNERPFDGRMYVMILDDLHTDALRSQRVKQAARQFIDRNLGANDRMAVLFTAGRAQDAQEFTSNKRLLTTAVDKFMGRKLPSPTIARNDEYYRTRDFQAGGSVRDPYDDERAFNARNMLSELKQVSDWFGSVHGRRKTILLFSEGIDYDIYDVIRGYDQPAGHATGILDEIRETLAATARSNVSIYAVDARGLTSLGDESIGVGSFANSDSGGTAPDGSAVAPPRDIGTNGLMNDLRLSQDSLRALSEDTGGFAAVNSNDFKTAFERIVKDNSSYYVLAYYPPNPKRDGKFHRIQVKVNRPGLTVRSRRGYAAARGNPPKPAKTGGMTEAMYEAINSPIPVSGMTLRAFAAPFKGTAPNASVLVGLEISGRDVTLDANSKVELSYMAIDAKSKVWGARNDAVTLNLKPETKSRVEQTGFRILNRIDLPAGRYQLRLAARDAAKQLAGSVIYDLEVPDFYKDTIGLSGLTLTSLAGASMLTVRPDEQLKQVLPASPVGLRTFPRNDELALFAEVYDNSAAAAHKVDITASILTDTGEVLFKYDESHDSSELKGAKGGYGFTARIPLSEIPPGSYVLRVEGRSRLGNNVSAAREIQFRVVPPMRGPAE
jgi:VWFA-related protein